MSQSWQPLDVSGTTGRVDATPADEANHIGVFGGWTLRNTAAAAATVDFYDNTSAASGNILGSVDLEAKGSAGACSTVEFKKGLRYSKGVYAVFSAAGVQGSVLIG